jgi:hypothetical protein
MYCIFVESIVVESLVPVIFGPTEVPSLAVIGSVLSFELWGQNAYANPTMDAIDPITPSLVQKSSFFHVAFDCIVMARE